MFNAFRGLHWPELATHIRLFDVLLNNQFNHDILSKASDSVLSFPTSKNKYWFFLIATHFDHLKTAGELVNCVQLFPKHPKINRFQFVRKLCRAFRAVTKISHERFVNFEVVETRYTHDSGHDIFRRTDSFAICSKCDLDFSKHIAKIVTKEKKICKESVNGPSNPGTDPCFILSSSSLSSQK